METAALPKRFYGDVTMSQTAEGDWQVLLDGRSAKTSARNLLSASVRPLANAITKEWLKQVEVIDPSTMPVTQRRMLVIDRGTEDLEKWRKQVLTFLSSDLLCYRADSPAELVERQKGTWDPYLQWAATEYGIDLKTAVGIISVDQPEKSHDRAHVLLDGAGEDELCCIIAATEITGSAVLALALWQDFKPVEDIFAASRVDETFQAEKWGTDNEAAEREAKLKADFFDVATYLSLIKEIRTY